MQHFLTFSNPKRTFNARVESKGLAATPMGRGKVTPLQQRPSDQSDEPDLEAVVGYIDRFFEAHFHNDTGTAPQSLFQASIEQKPGSQIIPCTQESESKAPCWVVREMERLSSGEFGGLNCEDCDLYKKTHPDVFSRFVDRLERMVYLINRQSSELSMTKELLESNDKYSMLGQEFAPIAHELNNLLGSMMGYAQLADLTQDEKDVRKCMEVVRFASAKARDILQKVKSYLHKNHRMKLQYIPELLDMVLSFLQPDLESAEVKVVRKYTEVPWMITDPAKLQKVLLIILTEIARSVPREGKIEISIRTSEDRIRIRIAGLRPVVSEQQLAFQEFQLEKQSTSEWKLLPLERLENARELVRDLGGQVSCHPLRGKAKGRSVIIKLPVR